MKNRITLFWWLTLILCLGATAMSDGQAVAEEPATETPPDGMVLIPAGSFEMGSEDEDARYDEQPVHTIHLDAFYMDKYEVTNAQFKAFVDANPPWQKDQIENEFRDVYLGHWNGNNYPEGKANHPVTHVDWYAAMAYAAWAGKRLPTEAEWEYAARGGLAGKKYPWGNTLTHNGANYNESFDDTTPVGQYAANGYGLYDMVGNVFEWCLDTYDADFYLASHNSRNPVSVSGGQPLAWLLENFKSLRGWRVYRGGSSGYVALRVDVAYRNAATSSTSYRFLGFRCVRPVMPAAAPVEEEAAAKAPVEEEAATEMPTPDGMVLIPAGQCQLGSNDDEAHENEQPVHTVHVDAFFMDIYEVTNAQYKAFVDANPQWQKDNIEDKFNGGDFHEHRDYLLHWTGTHYPAGKADHPVVYVSWYAAMAYAQWAGKRLPTEAEWEYAARGGLAGQKYPWGNTLTPADANYKGTVGDTTAVGRYAANGYGLYDMAGNVMEWCLDTYDEDFYRASRNSRNPVSVSGGQPLAWLLENFKSLQGLRVLRGGGWFNSARVLRVALRGWVGPAYSYSYSGFRCVKGNVTP